jgi:hypothetical protein
MPEVPGETSPTLKRSRSSHRGLRFAFVANSTRITHDRRACLLDTGRGQENADLLIERRLYMAARKKTSKSTTKRGTKKTSKKKTSRSSRSSKADRARVAASQRHEVAYLARKHGTTATAVKPAVKKVGSSRAKVEAELSK